MPCIIAENLTDDQIDAFRLVDNKSSEIAEWNPEALQKELKNLQKVFDMRAFNFEYEMPKVEVPGLDTLSGSKNETNGEESGEDPQEEEGYYGDARERTARLYLLRQFDPFRCSERFQMPIIEPTQHMPERLIGFNYAPGTDDFEAGVHFYLDDYQFERVWNNPQKYAERLYNFDCVLSPDFSLYLNMPLPMKIWNIYRSRLIGQIFQDYGCEVIPTISWAEEETFDFCFEGLREGGVISVSTIGVKRDEEAGKIWEAGMNEAIKRLKPSGIVVYGGNIGYDFGSVPVKYIQNEVTERWKGGK